MNGVHDMGGLECFGPINPDPNEALFHDEWVKRVLAMTVCMGTTGEWNLDQGRFIRESLPPVDYLSIGYYRIWLTALERLLIKRELVSLEEMQSGHSIDTAKTVKRVVSADDLEKALRAGSPVERPAPNAPVFSEGDFVCIANQHRPGHTRLPAYIRGHIGIVHKIHGCHVFADDNALGTGENPKWLYNIKFKTQELWGEPRAHAEFVHVDVWEPHLSAASRQ